MHLLSLLAVLSPPRKQPVCLVFPVVGDKKASSGSYYISQQKKGSSARTCPTWRWVVWDSCLQPCDTPAGRRVGINSHWASLIVIIIPIMSVVSQSSTMKERRRWVVLSFFCFCLFFLDLQAAWSDMFRAPPFQNKSPLHYISGFKINTSSSSSVVKWIQDSLINHEWMNVSLMLQEINNNKLIAAVLE